MFVPTVNIFLLFSFKVHDSASIFRFFNLDFYSIARQKFFYQFRPFDEAERTAVQIIFVSHIVHLFQFLDPVEIEVVNQLSGNFGTVFVYDGESREVMTSDTPSSSQTALIKVVLPAPILP